MRNLERLVRRLERKTSEKFVSEKPYCLHKKPVVSFPDGSIDGDTDRCRICSKPTLFISIDYPGSDKEQKRMLAEAKHFWAESEHDNSLKKLDRKTVLEIVCEEFQVAPGDIVST